MGTWFENSFLNACGKIYEWIVRIFSNLQSIFVFIMRIIWGYQFLIAGWGKLLHPERTAAFFHSLGLPFSTANTYIVGGFEFIGGILLIIGLASRLFAIPLSIIMLTALSTAHKDAFEGFKFIYMPSILVQEEPFPYLITCLTVLVYGPGRIAFDALIKKRLLSRF